MLGTSGVYTPPMTTHTACATPLRIYHTHYVQRSFSQGKKELQLSLSPSPSLPVLLLLFSPFSHSSPFNLFLSRFLSLLNFSHPSNFIYPGAPLITGCAMLWTFTVPCNGSMVDSTFSALLSQRERSRSSSPIRLWTTGMTLDSSHWLHWDEEDFPQRQ